MAKRKRPAHLSGRPFDRLDSFLLELYKIVNVIYYDQKAFLVIGQIMRDAVQTIGTRDAILDATDRLLARYGYKKMTIDDLAHEVGIGKGSVYLHFSSK